MTDKQTRLKPEVRRDEILSAAFALAASKHYQQLTCGEVAKRAGVSRTAVLYHFGTIGKLRAAIVRAAVLREHLPIIAQAVTAYDLLVLAAPQELRDRAVAAAS